MLGMMPKKSKIASVILAGTEGLKKGPEVPEEKGLAMDACAEKIMGAIEAKDKQALVAALEDFVSMKFNEFEMQEDLSEEG